MKNNQFGELIYTESDLFDLVMEGKNLFDTDKIFTDKTILIDKSLIVQNVNLETNIESNLSLEEFDKINQSNWQMPENYCPDLIENLYDLCQTDTERNRVSQELELFIKHDMIDLLHYLKYLVDTMNSNNVIWGVGRGSSVASYVLYLIGVHKINSIKYDLDIHEFLR